MAPSERDTCDVFCKASSLSPLANGFCFGEGPRWFEGMLWFSDMLGEAVHTVTLRGSLTTLAVPGHAPVGPGLPARRHPADRVDRSPPTAALRRRHRHPRRRSVRHWPPPTSVTWSSTTPAARTSDRRPARAASSCGSIPIDSATVVADGLDFPNGMVITPDGTTLIVAESIGRRLTAFTIGADGASSERRVFADGLDGPPDGIALDAEGGVWTSMTLAHQFERDPGRRRGHRPHRHRRPHRDRLRAGRAGAPHALPAHRARTPIRSGWSAPSCPASTR